MRLLLLSTVTTDAVVEDRIEAVAIFIYTGGSSSKAEL